MKRIAIFGLVLALLLCGCSGKQAQVQQGQPAATQSAEEAEQQEMVAIQTKLRDALDAVGRDGGYVCIFDLAGDVPYISKTLCEDVTAKLRTKLGIPANAVPAK